MARRWRQAATVAGLSVGVLALPGCLKRTISITTEPEGALVWLNDVEVGRTPLETDFTFYGTYDVRIRREGYEAIATTAKAGAPVQEWPGLDLVAEALPVTFHNVVRWHWVLTPREENVMGREASEAAMLERASELRRDALGEQAVRAEGEAAPGFAQPAPVPQEPPGGGVSP